MNTIASSVRPTDPAPNPTGIQAPDSPPAVSGSTDSTADQPGYAYAIIPNFVAGLPGPSVDADEAVLQVLVEIEEQQADARDRKLQIQSAINRTSFGQMASILDDKAGLQAEKAEKESLISANSDRFDELETKKGQLESQRDTLSLEIANSTDPEKTEKLESRRGSIDRELNAVNVEMSELQLDIDNLTGDIEELDRAITQGDGEIQSVIFDLRNDLRAEARDEKDEVERSQYSEERIEEDGDFRRKEIRQAVRFGENNTYEQRLDRLEADEQKLDQRQAVEELDLRKIAFGALAIIQDLQLGLMPDTAPAGAGFSRDGGGRIQVQI